MGGCMHVTHCVNSMCHSIAGVSSQRLGPKLTGTQAQSQRRGQSRRRLPSAWAAAATAPGTRGGPCSRGGTPLHRPPTHLQDGAVNVNALNMCQTCNATRPCVQQRKQPNHNPPAMSLGVWISWKSRFSSASRNSCVKGGSGPEGGGDLWATGPHNMHRLPPP